MKYSRTNVHKQQQSQVGGYSQHGGLYWIYAAMEWWMQPPHNGIKGGFVANAAGKDKISEWRIYASEWRIYASMI